LLDYECGSSLEVSKRRWADRVACCCWLVNKRMFTILANLDRSFHGGAG
jgi:hypothetical protein